MAAHSNTVMGSLNFNYMMKAESAYRIASKAQKKTQLSPVETAIQYIEDAIHDAALRGEMSVDLLLPRGTHLGQVQHDLLSNAYSFSIQKKTGKIRISWGSYMLFEREASRERKRNIQSNILDYNMIDIPSPGVKRKFLDI